MPVDLFRCFGATWSVTTYSALYCSHFIYIVLIRSCICWAHIQHVQVVCQTTGHCHRNKTHHILIPPLPDPDRRRNRENPIRSKMSHVHPKPNQFPEESRFYVDMERGPALDLRLLTHLWPSILPTPRSMVISFVQLVKRMWNQALILGGQWVRSGPAPESGHHSNYAANLAHHVRI
jgi:hypothetical protein